VDMVVRRETLPHLVIIYSGLLASLLIA
jgi:hypothetical protein